MPKAEGLIVIPAFNEEDNIKNVLKGIRQCRYKSLDILVVNDGSEDKTGIIARQLGEDVIDHLFNIGYGAALQTGFKYAAAKGYKYVIQFDSDGQHDPIDILPIIELLKSGFDIVIGSRFLEGNCDIGLIKLSAIRFLRLLIKLSTGISITDPTSGLQGLNRQVFEYYAAMGNFPSDYPDADTLITMLKDSYKVTEVAVSFRERTAGQSMHKGFKSIYYMLKMMVSISVVILRYKFRKKVEQYG